MAALLSLVGALLCVPLPASAAARQTDLFDFGWKFQLGDAPGAENPSFNDSSWRSLDLPHDWSIEGAYDEKAPSAGPGGYLPTGIGWYRKTFTLPAGSPSRSVTIQFDGVYEHSTVWINGHDVGTRPYGYSSFAYDLTPYLNAGSNVLAVKVDNSQQPNSRWYTGSGIYRHTWLEVTDALQISPWGIFVTTPDVTAEAATVHVTTHVTNGRKGSEKVEVRNEILGADGAPLGPSEVTDNSALTPNTASGDLAEGAEKDFQSSLVLRKPRLWSPDSPALYRVRTRVYASGVITDETETEIGVRKVEYDVDKGLLINGEHYKMRGMCIHHDAGAVGAAVPEAVMEHRLRLLKEMGCDAIRCSHYPMDPAFYAICDRIGLMVMDEAFDEWTFRKPQIQFGYSDIFNDWYERDVTSLVRRDRNHPSVVIWNAGNEIGEQRSPNGPDIIGKLVAVFHREDPTRPVTAAMDNIFNQDGEAPDAFTEKLDVVGYNYVDRWGKRRETQYTDDRRRYKDRKFIGTEESGVAVTRGDYNFGSLLDDNDSDDVLVLGNGPKGALYVASAIRASSLWRFDATHDYVIGEFIWTGFDYLGESKWPRKLTSFGALDTCGFKKDSYFFYQSIWTTKPMIHLLPHWNWQGKEGTVIPVVAYTNCAAVELFLNGKSLGVKAKEFPSEGVSGLWNHYDEPKIEATTADMQFVWDVVYAPGELKAVGYDKHGAVVSQDVVTTAGQPAKLQISVDRSSINSGKRDVAFITVKALDASGVFVPFAENQIVFGITGPAKLIGVDNGDPSSHASYQGNTRALFKGMALALVQSGSDAGTIHVTAHSDTLGDAQLDIDSRSSE
ncbi:MAG TPA: glycoside hydrolase family 2 TIM barrel-domain containing protein [Opitutaceae bacterium]|nr:glycoside hydrolase family 2 TIM barrel-domain containing protein [Opitutaceae bacterium]